MTTFRSVRDCCNFYGALGVLFLGENITCYIGVAIKIFCTTEILPPIVGKGVRKENSTDFSICKELRVKSIFIDIH